MRRDASVTPMFNGDRHRVVAGVRRVVADGARAVGTAGDRILGASSFRPAHAVDDELPRVEDRLAARDRLAHAATSRPSMPRNSVNTNGSKPRIEARAPASDCMPSGSLMPMQNGCARRGRRDRCVRAVGRGCPPTIEDLRREQAELEVDDRLDLSRASGGSDACAWPVRRVHAWLSESVADRLARRRLAAVPHHRAQESQVRRRQGPAVHRCRRQRRAAADTDRPR